MSIVRISSDLGIPIPHAILAKLGTKPGQEVMVTEGEGTIVLTPIPSDPVEYLCGVLQGESSLVRELTAERAQEVESE